jgi:hypothetical protein
MRTDAIILRDAAKRPLLRMRLIGFAAAQRTLLNLKKLGSDAIPLLRPITSGLK